MRSTVVGIALIVILAVFGLYAWATFQSRQASVCFVCSRPLHGGSSVVAGVDGKSRRFCCAACALWAERQTGAEVEITRVSDYASGVALDPAGATFVVGSRVNYCLQQHSVFDSSRTGLDPKETGTLEFDRCSPSVLAFKTPEAAIWFARREGGELTNLDGLHRLIP